MSRKRRTSFAVLACSLAGIAILCPLKVKLWGWGRRMTTLPTRAGFDRGGR
jgi:hypothetical protein